MPAPEFRHLHCCPEAGLQGGQSVLGLVSHELDRCQQAALPAIIWVESQRALENACRPVRLFELHQARGVGVQAFELGVKECTGLFKMTDRGSTVPLLVLQHRQHGMTGGIAGPLAQHAL